MNQDTSFKDYSELYKWASERKPMEANGHRVKYSDSGYFSMIGCDLHDFKKVFEKKKVVLYRFTLSYSTPFNQLVQQTSWASCHTLSSDSVILKTESKEIELD